MSVGDTQQELWGGETRKAVENFPVSGERVPVPVVRWLGRIKAAAARVNAELGLLDEDIAERVARAGQRLVDVDEAQQVAPARPDVGDFEQGVALDDLQRAIRVEYKENEIFPKTDTQEDWLKLLDYEPENVVNLKPIRPSKSAGGPRRSII